MIEELREAAKPIDLEALFNAQEVVYAQLMQMSPMPTSPASGDRACDARSGRFHGRRREEPVRPGGEVHRRHIWLWSRARKGTPTSTA